MKSSDLLLIGILLLLFGVGGYVVYDKTRGLRNNNPGNIRHGDPWQGMRDVQTDGSFVQFISPEYGIRAMARILSNYSKAGINTLRSIISRWAPPDENPTDALITNASRRLNIHPDAPLDVDLHLPSLIDALIFQENGVQPYSSDIIARGIALAR